MLRDTLARIAGGSAAARDEPFGNHPFARYVRSEAPEEVRAALGVLAEGVLCEGSAGAGRWADVPWLAVFDPVVTASATTGYYVVYLFSHGEPVVHLSLNQGTTAVRRELGIRAPDILRDRARLMRARIPDYLTMFDTYELVLGSTSRLPLDYESGHAIGRRYELSTLPAETFLRDDLQNLVRAYLALTFRGGLDPSLEVTTAEEPGSEGTDLTLTEVRRYRLHRRIERNPKASQLAKKIHGLICHVCRFDFSARYGDLGRGYIEAHHLKPLSALEEGVPITSNPKTDFVVLCANCHRMIHKLPDAADVSQLRATLQEHA